MRQLDPHAVQLAYAAAREMDTFTRTDRWTSGNEAAAAALATVSQPMQAWAWHAAARLSHGAWPICVPDFPCACPGCTEPLD